MRFLPRYILAGLCAGFLILCLVVPIILTIGAGFTENGRLTGYWLTTVFTDLAVREGLVNALKLAGVVTLGATALALPLALLTNRYSFRGKALASALLMAPMILPPFVGAIAMKKLLAYEEGSINLLLSAIGLGKVDWLGSGFPAVAILEVLHLFPIMYLNVSAALANVDPTMAEAARSLGASRWQSFWRVTLPLIRPGVFAGGTIVFVWSFTELGTPLMFSYQVLPVQIFLGLNSNLVSAKTFSMVFVLLGASVGLYLVGKVLFGRTAGATVGRGVAATLRKAGTGTTLLIWLAFGVVTLTAVLPHIGVVLMSFARKWSGTILPESFTLQHVLDVFQREKTWNSIVNSLHYASLATVIDVVAGLVIAYLVVRLKVRGGWLLDGLAMLPLAVPGIIIAGGYVALTTRGLLPEPLGSWLERFSPRQDPTLILILAYSVRRLPYVVRAIASGLEQTSPTLEEAARSLGASPLRSITRITVPLISANVLAGALLAFSFAMLEVSDSLILAQREQYHPITAAIYSIGELADTVNLAAAMGMLAMVLLIATLVGANLLLGRRMGAMFRV